MDKKDFDILVSREDFQNDLIHFESFTLEEKKNFQKKYQISKEQFVQAKTIIDILNFKEIRLSEIELDYLWDQLEERIVRFNTKPVKEIKLDISWIIKIAAILFVPLLAGSVFIWGRSVQLRNLANEQITQLSEISNNVYAPVGGKTKAVLPDGSEVWLNSGSSIQYPVIGKENYREVTLKGEGFFNVVKDPSKPMIVTAGEMKIKVYGTSFNINAYAGNPTVETFLAEGKISILNNGKPDSREFEMKPGELAKFDKNQKNIVISRANKSDIYTGWVSGKHVFRNIQFKDILKRLELIHNVQFELRDPTLGEYYFDATFEDQTIDRIMEIFELSLPIKWESIQAQRNKNNSFTTRTIMISRDKSKILRE